MQRRPPRRGRGRHRKLRRILGVLGIWAALAAYYRFRPQPAGIDGTARSYRVPAEKISFLHDTTWYEGQERHCVREIAEAVIDIVREARSFVLMDVFLFNLHHMDQPGPYVGTTRQIADAFAGKQHPSWFITDPLNTAYGTATCDPLEWLKEAGVTVCTTNLRKLRDNNMLYSPVWRVFLQWFGTGGRSGNTLPSPVRKDKRTTIRAVLKALNAKGNHRKVVVADRGGEHVCLLTSSNFEDSSSYFINTGLMIRDSNVASHFLEAEKALARVSGCEVTARIAPVQERGEALVTPLMGEQIKRAVIADVDAAELGDELSIILLFLSERDVITALKRAADRGVRIRLLLDQNKVSFGSEKTGFPNQFVAPELAARGNIEVRWGNTRKEEFHAKFMLLKKRDRCIVNTGSANFTRRSLSGTNPEANVRVEMPLDCDLAVQLCRYAEWMSQELRTIPFHGRQSWPKYWFYRFQEAVGVATF